MSGEPIWLVWECHKDGRIELRGVALEEIRAQIMRTAIYEEGSFAEHHVEIEKRESDHIFGGSMMKALQKISKKQFADPYRGYSDLAKKLLKTPP